MTGKTFGGWLTKRFRNGGAFMYAAATIISGTVIAQGLSFAALPFLTRIYDPNDFATLGVFLALVNILSVVACLRLEIAIPLPDDDDTARHLLALALLFCVMSSALVSVVLFAWPQVVVGLSGAPALSAYALLLCPAVLLAGTFNALQYWATRKKYYASITGARIAQAVAGIGTQLALGITVGGALGLLAGNIAFAAVGAIFLTPALWRSDEKPINQMRWSKLKAALTEYKRFPQYSALEALANAAGASVPILLIASSVSSVELGLLVLASRAIASPLQLIGGAVSQVYLSRAPAELQSGRLAAFTWPLALALGGVGATLFLFLAIAAPTLFSVMFGEEWRGAGDVVRWLTPWFILQLVAFSLSPAMHIAGRNDIALVLQLSGLILRVGAVAASTFLFHDFELEAFAISSAVFYLIYVVALLAITRMADNPQNSIRASAK